MLSIWKAYGKHWKAFGKHWGMLSRKAYMESINTLIIHKPASDADSDFAFQESIYGKQTPFAFRFPPPLTGEESGKR
jgi:deoxyxylulose-5-phosphate synthase